DGAFDEAVKGVDAIAHTASPFHFQADDPQTLIEPAVKGTVGILKSIEKHAPGIQRVVVTSSAAAIADTSKPTGTIFAEVKAGLDLSQDPRHIKIVLQDDWNTFSTKEVEKKGSAAAGADKYRASKTLAEKAAWVEVEAKKPTWDLVLGPIMHQLDDLANLNTSVAMPLYKITYSKEGETSNENLLQPNMNFVDVRDVALAHLRALEVPEAGGQRFITAGETVEDTELALRERGWGVA
ncbi:methylglyoxal reductase (NADPH-dependent) gre2, partial [Ceratobasidium sp. 392]